MAQVVACATNIGLFVMDFGGGGAGPAGIAMGVVRCPIASHERWIGCRGGGGGGGGSTSHSIPNDAIDKPTGIRALRVAVDDTGRIALQPCCIGGGSSDRLMTARIASYVCRAGMFLYSTRFFSTRVHESKKNLNVIHIFPHFHVVSAICWQRYLDR